MNLHDLQTVWAPRLLSVLRIVAALLFLEHGTQKLLGFPPSPHPSPALLSIFGIAGLLEIVAGALLLVGWFTRPVAFILSGEMAVAYWMAHAPRSVFPILNGGDAAILYCFVFLYLARGRRSVEHRRASETCCFAVCLQLTRPVRNSRYKSCGVGLRAA